MASGLLVVLVLSCTAVAVVRAAESQASASTSASVSADASMSASIAARTRAAMEVEHYERLWMSGEHTANVGGSRSWMCCRACPQATVPMMHEAFEGDKNDQPDMAASPPEAKKAFVEVGSSSSSSEEWPGRHGRHGRRHHRPRDDHKSYSCCNMCPDIMAPFPKTWNEENPYQYTPEPMFRFKQMRTSADSEDSDAEAEAESEESSEEADEADAAESDAEDGEEDAVFAELSSDVSRRRRRHRRRGPPGVPVPPPKPGAGISKYVATNPHHLPQYAYWESLRRAAAARDKARREGYWDKPVKPGASPIWHPPPPPHDDIFRISRSPNLHDGSDLKSAFVMPPCCDFCMSGYFPHIINDELQLPTREPFTVARVNAALLQTDEAMTDGAEPMAMAETKAKAEASFPTISNPKKCCHKCIRKDIEDTDWQVYALPPKKTPLPWRERWER